MTPSKHQPEYTQGGCLGPTYPPFFLFLFLCVCVYGYKARASFTLGKHHTRTPVLLSFASLLSVPEGAIPWLSSEPWSLQLAQLESHLPHLPPQNLHLLISLLHRFSS